MNNLSNISVIKSLLLKHGFKFSKSLGQNFIINPSVCPKMAESCIENLDCGVLEIGPGIGVLTNELAKRAKKVVSIEIDKKLMPVLGETLGDLKNVKIINEDFMKIDINKIIKEEFAGIKVVVCANLPYYITSSVIMRFLEEKINIENITVMVQKEAAERLIAKPGTREVGAISLAVQYYSEPELLFKVSRNSFMPAPNVDSAVIKLNIRKKSFAEVKNESNFFSVIKATFAQRRKVISNSLSSGLNIPKNKVKDLLICSGIDINARPENLNIEEFAKISNILYKSHF